MEDQTTESRLVYEPTAGCLMFHTETEAPFACLETEGSSIRWNYPNGRTRTLAPQELQLLAWTGSTSLSIKDSKRMAEEVICVDGWRNGPFYIGINDGDPEKWERTWQLQKHRSSQSANRESVDQLVAMAQAKGIPIDFGEHNWTVATVQAKGIPIDFGKHN